MDKKIDTVENAKNWPKVKTAKFLTQGLVSYEDVGQGIAKVTNETIHAGLPSFVGKPVIMDHSDVTPENYEKHRKGNVIGTSYNSQDGWFYVDFLVDDDEMLRCIEEEGYSVSCAYNVLDVAPGGTYQDIPYDGEITKISFTHLAIVKVPRYEESRIMDEMPAMMINSKITAKNITKQEGEKMFKLFKKNQEGKQEEVTPFVMVNGKEVSLQELVEAHSKVNSKDQKYMAKDEDLVDVNGNSVSIGEMKKTYLKNMKKNAGPDGEEGTKEEQDDDKGAEKSEKEVEKAAKESGKKKNEKEDEQEDDVEKDETKTKKNAKEQGDTFFAEMQNASSRAHEQVIEDEGSRTNGMTREERAASWKARNSKKD